LRGSKLVSTARALYIVHLKTQSKRGYQMTLSTGATLPDATLMKMGAEGPVSP